MDLLVHAAWIQKIKGQTKSRFKHCHMTSQGKLMASLRSQNVTFAGAFAKFTSKQAQQKLTNTLINNQF